MLTINLYNTTPMHTYKFVREGSGWYIDLPDFLENGLGTKADLAMVAGADTMLDHVAGNADAVALTLSLTPFADADRLSLQELCGPGEGGYYLLDVFEGAALGQRMWLCAVTEYVFGSMPREIFIRRAK
ncbi:MAG: hypothetical protein EOO04_07900 [Chitinophagaceae bacterium]|nr:MAG: hypothetical protein EOO04_07900 [Chitinophagaceae bacterium]